MTDQGLGNTLQNLFLVSVAELWFKDCDDLQQFSKGPSHDELEFCQILN